MIGARVKKADDLAACPESRSWPQRSGLPQQPVDAKNWNALKRHLRYSFALQLNNSEAIAGTVARICRAAPHAGNHQPLLRPVREADAGRYPACGEEIPDRAATGPISDAHRGAQSECAVRMLLTAGRPVRERCVAHGRSCPENRRWLPFALCLPPEPPPIPADKPGLANLTGEMLGNSGTQGHDLQANRGCPVSHGDLGLAVTPTRR